MVVTRHRARAVLAGSALLAACVVAPAQTGTPACIRHPQVGRASHFEIGGERVSDAEAMALLEADPAAGAEARHSEHYVAAGSVILVSALAATLGLLTVALVQSDQKPYLIGAAVASGGGVAVAFPVLWEGRRSLDDALARHNTACRP
jgi:hypothetical protein